MTLTFVETPFFTKQIISIGDKETYWNLQKELLQDPEKGALIKGTGGLRKVRMASATKGKSGGYRVIYLYVMQGDKIIFVHAYGKNKQEDLTPDDKKTLRNLVQILIEEERKAHDKKGK